MGIIEFKVKNWLRNVYVLIHGIPVIRQFVRGNFYIFRNAPWPVVKWYAIQHCNGEAEAHAKRHEDSPMPRLAAAAYQERNLRTRRKDFA